MTSIAVVGVGGVGMAHVIAAANCGYRVAAIVDRNPGTLLRARERWVNTWMDFTEEVHVQLGKTYYFTDVDQLESAGQLDTIIVATPPHTHQTLMNRLYKLDVPILCEKPCAYPETPVASRSPVYISTEWIHHDGLKQYEDVQIKTMRMSYPESKTTNWGYSLPSWLDYASHYFSVLESLGYEIESFTKVNGILFAHTSEGKVSLSSDRQEPYGFFINGDKLDWQEDLFQRQLSTGKSALTWNHCGYLETKLLAAMRS